jgi:hypothetical protein
MGGACGTYEGEEMHTGFRWGNLKEAYLLEDLGVNGRILLKWILMDGSAWTGFIWLRTGTKWMVLLTR